MHLPDRTLYKVMLAHRYAHSLRDREGERERGRGKRGAESLLLSAGLVSWSSFDLMILRVYKEKSYVLEAKTTVQRSLES